jgi:hypothetical protein
VPLPAEPVPYRAVLHTEVFYALAEALPDGPSQQGGSSDSLFSCLHGLIAQGVLHHFALKLLCYVQPHVFAGCLEPILDCSNAFVLRKYRALGPVCLLQHPPMGMEGFGDDFAHLLEGGRLGGAW